MLRIAGRPAGVVLIATLVALNGVASLVEAFEFAQLAAGGAPSATALLIGLALLHRAYGLWRFHHGAWVMTLLLVGLKAVSAALALVLTPAPLSVWISLTLAVAIMLYLIRPGVRALFV